MDLKNISLHLKQSIVDEHANTLSLSPWAIAGFLDICRRSLYGYITQANEQLGTDSEAYISATELEKIDSVFRELSDNFFPMAHSNMPLRDLQIVNKSEFESIQSNLEHMKYISSEVNHVSKELSDSIQCLINP
jgi:hypothetical protein